jgi:hypothetical protein
MGDLARGARVHRELDLHPVAVRIRERPDAVELLGAEDVHEEPDRLVEVWNGEGDVLDAACCGDSATSTGH